MENKNNTKYLFQLFEIGKKAFIKINEDNSLSFNQALKASNYRFADESKKAILEQFIEREKDSILNVMRSQICNEILMNLQELADSYRFYGHDIFEVIENDEGFLQLKEDIFGNNSNLASGESARELFKGLRNAFAHGNVDYQTVDEGYRLAYYSKSLQDFVDVNITTDHIVNLVAYIAHATSKCDIKEKYLWSTHNLSGYLKNNKIDEYVRGIQVNKLKLNGRAYQKVSLDDKQQLCLKNMIENNTVEGVESYYLIEKIFFNNAEKVTQAMHTYNLLSYIKENKDRPFLELRDDYAEHCYYSAGVPDKNVAYDCSPNNVLMNVMVAYSTFALTEVEKKSYLSKLDFLANIKEDSKNIKWFGNKVRNSLIHGRFIFDGKDNLFLYDGADHENLRYVTSLNFQELNSFQHRIINVLKSEEAPKLSVEDRFQRHKQIMQNYFARKKEQREHKEKRAEQPLQTEYRTVYSTSSSVENKKEYVNDYIREKLEKAKENAKFKENLSPEQPELEEERVM